MSPKNNSEPEDDLRDEYNFRGGVRVKFYKRIAAGLNQDEI